MAFRRYPIAQVPGLRDLPSNDDEITISAEPVRGSNRSFVQRVRASGTTHPLPLQVPQAHTTGESRGDEAFRI